MSRHNARKPQDLPSRFPIGTKFVIEGRPAGAGEVQVFKRFIEFPDGTLVRLSARGSGTLRRVRKTVAEQSRPV
jgi:hypothetical protein